MDFIITSPIQPRAFFKGSGLRNGGDNSKGLDNIVFIHSKQKRFLDLLAAQRKKNVPGQLHGIDLSHLDLSNLDLSGIDLTGANLTNTNLSGAKLIGTNLTNATLIRTIFTNATLDRINLTNAVIDRTAQLSLRQAINQRLYEAAQKSIDGFHQKWEKLKGIDGFNAFEAVLKRLNELSLNTGVTMSEIIEVIDSIIKSPEIGRLVFTAAQSADMNCDASLLTIFNTAQGLTKFGKLLSDNAEQKEILALAKSMVRQNLLDEAILPIMRNQWSEGRRSCNGNGTGPKVNEAMKVQLALRQQLASKLQLPAPVKNSLNAIDIAGLTHSDIEFAVDLINKHVNDQEQLIDALIALPLWQLYLERVLKIKIDEAHQIDIDALLQLETEKIVFAEAA